VEVICSVRHPAAEAVADRSSSRCEGGTGDLYGCDSPNECTRAACSRDHDVDDCAACLIAAGYADDVTRRHYDYRTGRLIG